MNELLLNRPWLAHYDAGVPWQIDYPAKRLFDLLDDAARQHPNAACILFEDQVLTYREMAKLTDRLSAGLSALGLQKGERVGILLPNLPQFVLAYYAILKAGGVVVALNPNFTAREVLHHFNDAGVVMLISLRSAETMLSAIRSETQLRAVIWSDPEDATRMAAWLDLPQSSSFDTNTTGDYALADLVRLAGSPPTKAAITPDDPAIFQYSGGTTGTPKAAVGLHRNLVANTVQFRHWLAGLEDGKETVLLAIPLYHVYGMVVGMSVGVLLAARLALVPNPRDLTGLLNRIETTRASFYPGVPAMYAAINRHPDVQAGKYDLRSIRACISGSAPLLEEVRLSFEALTGAQLMEGYGLSEAPTATHCNPMLGEKRAGSIGLPLPDVECRIVDLEGGDVDLPAGEPGELIIRGPQVMSGYYQMPDETAEALRDGWLHTGDIARMDEDGYFYIVDRKKDLIKVSGFQVWPREIEEVLAMHPGVLEVAVAGIPHPVKGEAVKAWVVLRPEASLEAKDLVAWCRRSLVYYKVPVEVEFRSSLPRTGVGKLLRRELIREHIEKRP